MKKRRSTFTWMMIESASISLLCLVVMMGVFYYAMRSVHINHRMNSLKSQAYDIADLSGALNARGDSLFFLFNESVSRQLLEKKLKNVYEEYTAYCLVVDRNGQGSSYFLSILNEHKELTTNFDAQSIVNTLKTVLDGQEVVTRNNTKDGPMFTVAVPWINQERVMGAVYIQTAAQVVHASYADLVLKVFAAAMLVFLLTVIVGWFFNKRITKPLTRLVKASHSVARGEYNVSVAEEGSLEMIEFSSAFNSMAAQLKETEQMRRDFIANVSHELGSPMTSIQGFVSGILDGTIRKEDEKQYLQIVLSESKRLSKLVSELLSLSKIENEETTFEYTVFDMHELIRLVVITKINMIEEKGIEISLRFPDSPLWVHANHDGIEQVMINLLDNALKYTPPKGHVEILTRTLNPTQIAVTIRDDGIGILAADRPYVFERFYMADKAHTSGKGTGLGLAICKKIIDKHGQKLTLLPEERGAAFEFTLESISEGRVK